MSDPVELTVPTPLPSRGRGGDGRLHLMALHRNRQRDLDGGPGEGQAGSVLWRREILRGLVGDPGRLELGVRSTKSSGRLDAVAEWSAGDQARQPDRCDPDAALGFVDPERRLHHGLEVRHCGRGDPVERVLDGILDTFYAYEREIFKARTKNGRSRGSSRAPGGSGVLFVGVGLGLGPVNRAGRVLGRGVDSVELEVDRALVHEVVTRAGRDVDEAQPPGGSVRRRHRARAPAAVIMDQGARRVCLTVVTLRELDEE